MIGISRGKDTSIYSNRVLKKAVKAQTKKFKNKDGTVKVCFCSRCDNPVHTDDLFIDISGIKNKPSVLCPLCFFPENLDLIPTSDSGVLIYAPELTQSQVNTVALMVAYIRGLESVSPDVLELSSDVDDLMMSKGAILTNILASGANIPSVVCQFLYMMDGEDYSRRSEMLSPVRLYPSPSTFKHHLDYLSENVLKTVSPNKWVSLLQVINKEMKKSDD